MYYIRVLIFVWKETWERSNPHPLVLRGQIRRAEKRRRLRKWAKSDRHERRQLGDAYVDLMLKRVRLDLEASFFTFTYRLEISCMFKPTRDFKFNLIRMVRLQIFCIFLCLLFYFKHLCTLVSKARTKEFYDSRVEAEANRTPARVAREPHGRGDVRARSFLSARRLTRVCKWNEM